jgi:hypothetical protein
MCSGMGKAYMGKRKIEKGKWRTAREPLEAQMDTDVGKGKDEEKRWNINTEGTEKGGRTRRGRGGVSVELEEFSSFFYFLFSVFFFH